MENLSPRLREVLELIVACREEGYSPSYKEVGERLGLARRTAQQYVETLIARGYLERSERLGGRLIATSRSRSGRPGFLPQLGRIVAGEPLEAVEDVQWLDVRDLVPTGPDHFLLEVHGDSMTGAGILPGDRVVVRAGPAAASGQVVVAEVAGEVTLKRLRKRAREVELVPENPAYETVRARDVRILGVVVGLVRRLQ